MGDSAADGGAKGQTPSDPAAPAAPAQSARAADDVPEGFVVLANRSPYGRLIGPVYEKATPEGRVFGVRIAEKHVNLGGIAHGGMMASFADAAAAVLAVGASPATIEPTLAAFARTRRALLSTSRFQKVSSATVKRQTLSQGRSGSKSEGKPCCRASS